MPEPETLNSEITIRVSADNSKILPSKNVISAFELLPDLIVSPAWRSIPAVPEIQSLVPDRFTKISPSETEKMVTGSDGVVVITVVVGDVVADWVGDTVVDVGVFVDVVGVDSTGIVDVGVVAVDVVVGVVLPVQANTLVRTNKDSANITITLLKTDLLISIYILVTPNLLDRHIMRLNIY